MGCPALLQGFFPNQGSNPVFLHCRQIQVKKKKGKKVIFQKFTERLSPSARKSLLENGIYNQIDPPLLDGNII